MSAQGAPVRSRQNIPFKTRRSSTRATPRGLFGSKGPITDHSKSVKSKRAIQTSIAGHLNHRSPKNGIPFMGMWPRAKHRHFMSSESSTEKTSVSLLSLIMVFSRVGITSFGGSTAAWLYRELVQRRGWIDEEHFVTALTICQVLPGANPVNLSIYVG